MVPKQKNLKVVSGWLSLQFFSSNLFRNFDVRTALFQIFSPYFPMEYGQLGRTEVELDFGVSKIGLGDWSHVGFAFMSRHKSLDEGGSETSQ